MTDEERKKLKEFYVERLKKIAQIYSEPLIENIKEAFAEVSYPSIEFFAGSLEHNKKCEECREVNDFFIGKKWKECLNDDSYGKLCAGQSFFYAPAWHYYLPAYLIQKINRKKFHTDYEFQEELDEDIPELIKWQKERINLLTSAQCRVIIDYLEITLKVWEGIEKGYEDDLKALNFWKENYQKALAKEQNLQK